MSSAPRQPSQAAALTAIRKRLRALETRRSLGNASFGKGGIMVNPGSTAVSLRVEQYDGSLGGTPGPAGTLAFLLPSGKLSRLRLIDTGLAAGAVTLLESVPNAGGFATGISLSPSNGVGMSVPSSGSVNQFFLGGSASSGGNQLSVNINDHIFVIDSGGTISLDNMRWRAMATEWRATDTSNAYVPVRASSFPTSSSRGQKQNVTDLPFDPLEAIDAAPAYRWQYKPKQAADDRFHVSPMADDLPADLVEGTGADMNVDTRDLVGVLWAAVRQLQQQIEALTDRVATLEGKH